MMISNRYYLIPPFSVKPETTRVEVGRKRFPAKLWIFCHEQNPMSRKIKKILIIEIHVVLRHS
jgi:hypothetical protein